MSVMLYNNIENVKAAFMEIVATFLLARNSVILVPTYHTDMSKL